MHIVSVFSNNLRFFRKKVHFYLYKAVSLCYTVMRYSKQSFNPSTRGWKGTQRTEETDGHPLEKTPPDEREQRAFFCHPAGKAFSFWLRRVYRSDSTHEEAK